MNDTMEPNCIDDPNKTQTNGTNNPTLTLRMIMQGKEVGSIIGKKGDNVKKFREESGAKINISDNSCPERIVTVMGGTDAIVRAFSMICKKFEEDLAQNNPGSPQTKHLVTVRLVIPASQCGSLIGKAGAKIKEIRESTGATIQVASEMLPNSTERAVTISGTSESITSSIYHICCVMLEVSSPPKGATIPYRPKPAIPPVVFAGGQAYAVPSPYIMPPALATDPNQVGNVAAFDENLNAMPLNMLPGSVPPGAPQMADPLWLSAMPHLALSQQSLPFLSAGQPIIPESLYSSIIPGGFAGPIPGLNHIAAFPRPQNPAASQQTHEMNIPNDLIGCIIGRGGSKINEIRQLSGATIKISNSEEGSSDRKVTIQGTPETVNAAQYLINASMELHKSLTLTQSTPPSSVALTPSPSYGLPMTSLVKAGYPAAMLGIGQALQIADEDAARKALTTKIRSGLSGVMQNGKKIERPKFSPY